MTDREMLELAAKAAGVGSVVWGGKYKLGDDVIDCTDISYVRSGQPDVSDIHWNPLLDDGDALRLAVSLGLVVDCSRPSAAPPYHAHTPAEIGASDPYAATRRAIVRAAAEIGRQME